MNKFKVGDRVRVDHASIPYMDDEYVGNVYTVNNFSNAYGGYYYALEGVKYGMHEEQLKLISSEYYILEYMEKDGDFSMEEFDTKEEALESVEENSYCIDFDEPVKLLVVSKVFDVKKTKRFELVEE